MKRAIFDTQSFRCKKCQGCHVNCFILIAQKINFSLDIHYSSGKPFRAIQDFGDEKGPPQPRWGSHAGGPLRRAILTSKPNQHLHNAGGESEVLEGVERQVQGFGHIQLGAFWWNQRRTDKDTGWSIRICTKMWLHECFNCVTQARSRAKLVWTSFF